MDNQRTLLFAALAFVSILIWQAWQKDYVIPQAPAVAEQQQKGSVLNKDLPEGVTEEKSAIDIDNDQYKKQLAAKGEIIRVNTDVYNLEINTLGGGISQMQLRQYPEEKGKKG